VLASSATLSAIAPRCSIAPRLTRPVVPADAVRALPTPTSTTGTATTWALAVTMRVSASRVVRRPAARVVALRLVIAISHYSLRPAAPSDDLLQSTALHGSGPSSLPPDRTVN
jgi:hypothetical protein